MIAYLKGTLEETGEDYLVLEVNGIGYQVKTPGRVLEAVSGIGSTIKLHTYTYVREDTLALYGFLTRDDLSMFQLLLGVSGVGPKGALGILSLFSAGELRMAILSQDAKAIAKAPGIGAKTAQRMLIDLKGKVSFEDTFGGTQEEVAKAMTGDNYSQARNDATEALTALGYSASESLKAVSAVAITEEMDSEAILKAALKKLL
ncbi:MAG: Holliday junction branch migration protein RuvA [Lachnospiraceae bacterium]|nr:Holliday junction branch migration protein RuvA [Lachnospiraceae bacterium]MDD7027191.1 Holliday junction branch migration protein RuvA [Lachnospiraceae bacterium]MDY5700637.1 Holliday junction branch migration protein RuvA [Lachnospiraceae bacterium]